MARTKKRKIMSIDELYNFCLKNNFVHFSSNEFGKEIMVRMNGNFEKNNKDNNKHLEGLTPFISKAFHDHVNLNKSEIPNDSFNENVSSANFRPILANITTNSDGELDFGSHDYYITTDKDGNDKVVYEEQPIGVIDGSKTTIEYDEDADVNRAVLHGYLYDEYCQDAIDILNRRGTVDCSVELCIRELGFNNDNKTLLLEDFYVSGLTLLSQDVKPGMAGSNFKIEDFAISTETLDFNTDNKLVETLDRLSSILESLTIDKNTLGKEEIEVGDKENFDEVTETEVEETVTETEETTEEEVTVTENESEETVDETPEESDDSVEEDVSEPNNNENVTDYSLTVKFADKEFAISLQEKIYALSDLVNAQYAEADNTWYSVTAYDDYVIMCDWWSGKYFKQTYSEEDNVFTLTGDRIPVFAEFVTEEELNSLNTMRSNYASLVEFKENVEKNEFHAKREEILANEKYESIRENEAFKELVANMDNYSLEDLEKEAKIIFADNVSIETFASNEKKSNGIKLFADVNKTKKPNRYGNLFSGK